MQRTINIKQRFLKIGGFALPKTLLTINPLYSRHCDNVISQICRSIDQNKESNNIYILYTHAHTHVYTWPHDFYKGTKEMQWSKGYLFNNWCQNNWILIWIKITLNPYFTPYTRGNSKHTIHLNTNSKHTIHLNTESQTSRRKHRRNLCDLEGRQDFLGYKKHKSWMEKTW